MIIRRLEKQDIPQVLEICKEMREYHRQILGGFFKPLDEDYERQSLQSIVDDVDFVALVALKNEKIVGWLCAEFMKRPYLEITDLCHIRELGVLKAFRRQKIGQALMQSAFTLIKNRGIHEISLGVFNQNIEAYKFYEKLGFVPLEQKMKISI